MTNESIEKKLKLIDAICLWHPSYGVEKGWSEYTGGMKDSGQWFLRTMLNSSLKELQDFLDKIKREASRPTPEPTEEEIRDSKTIHEFNNGLWSNEAEVKRRQQFRMDLISKLFFNA